MTLPPPSTQQLFSQPQLLQLQEIVTTELMVEFANTTAELSSSFNIASTSGTYRVPTRKRQQRTINSYIAKPITQDIKKN